MAATCVWGLAYGCVLLDHTLTPSSYAPNFASHPPAERSAALITLRASLAQVGVLHLLAMAERGAGIRQHYAATFQQVTIIRHIQRHMHVLLDQQHGGASRANLRDDAEDLFDQQ